VANDAQRWLLEARLLTRQAIVQTARDSSLPRTVVEEYTKLFFDVRRRRRARDAILLLTMRKVVREQVLENDVDVLLKLFAFFGGVAALDAVASILLSPTSDLSLLPPSQRRLAEKVQRFVRLLTKPWTLASSANGTASPATSEAKQRPQSLIESMTKFVAMVSALKREEASGESAGIENVECEGSTVHSIPAESIVGPSLDGDAQDFEMCL
jgi:hypothetical protein